MSFNGSSRDMGSERNRFFLSGAALYRKTFVYKKSAGCALNPHHRFAKKMTFVQYGTYRDSVR